MPSRRTLGLLVLLALATGLGCGRRGGGAILLGAGETISHRADFTPQTRAVVQQQTGFTEPAVGFKYEYFSMFFLDLWTGGGKIVVYDAADGEQYVELADDELRTLTNLAADDFGKPFLYRFPLGWFVILALVGAFVVITWRRMRALG